MNERDQSAAHLRFRVMDNLTVKLVKDDGTEVDTTEDMKAENTSTSPAMYVGNEPGKPLPSAGGPGTVLGTLAGVAMMAIAGLVLARRRRSQEA